MFGEELDRVFGEEFDLLLGRKTYEIFAAYWPYYDEERLRWRHRHSCLITISKYAVSHSGEVDTG